MRAVLIRNKDANEFEKELNIYLYRDCWGGYERGVNDRKVVDIKYSTSVTSMGSVEYSALVISTDLNGKN